MGEIGIPHHTALHELDNWQIQQVITGYNRRNRELLSIVRWQTHYLMAAQVGGKALAEAGIHGPTDLLKFPWDTDTTPELTQEDVDDIVAELEAINADNKVNPRP